MKLHTVEFEIGESVLRIGNLELGVNDAFVNYERDMDYGQIVRREGYGEINLKKKPPQSENIWVRESGVPKVFENVEIENDEQRIRLGEVIVAYPPQKDLEFVSTMAARDIKP